MKSPRSSLLSPLSKKRGLAKVGKTTPVQQILPCFLVNGSAKVIARFDSGTKLTAIKSFKLLKSQ